MCDSCGSHHQNSIRAYGYYEDSDESDSDSIIICRPCYRDDVDIIDGKRFKIMYGETVDVVRGFPLRVERPSWKKK